jgi:hypothetical protein
MSIRLMSYSAYQSDCPLPRKVRLERKPARPDFASLRQAQIKRSKSTSPAEPRRSRRMSLSEEVDAHKFGQPVSPLSKPRRSSDCILSDTVSFRQVERTERYTFGPSGRTHSSRRMKGLSLGWLAKSYVSNSIAVRAHCCLAVLPIRPARLICNRYRSRTFFPGHVRINTPSRGVCRMQLFRLVSSRSLFPRSRLLCASVGARLGVLMDAPISL